MFCSWVLKILLISMDCSWMRTLWSRLCSWWGLRTLVMVTCLLVRPNLVRQLFGNVSKTRWISWTKSGKSKTRTKTSQNALTEELFQKSWILKRSTSTNSSATMISPKSLNNGWKVSALSCLNKCALSPKTWIDGLFAMDLSIRFGSSRWTPCSTTTNSSLLTMVTVSLYHQMWDFCSKFKI